MRERSILLNVVAALIFSIAPPALALVLAAPGHEAAVYTGTREVRLDHGAVFDGELLPEGTYRLAWGMNRDRERVEVRLFEGRRMVATSTGRLVDRPSVSPYDSVVFTRARNGERELAEIRFAGSASAIALVEDAPTVAGSR